MRNTTLDPALVEAIAERVAHRVYRDVADVLWNVERAVLVLAQSIDNLSDSARHRSPKRLVEPYVEGLHVIVARIEGVLRLLEDERRVQ